MKLIPYILSGMLSIPAFGSTHIERRVDCSLLEHLVELSVPEDVKCTDNGSKQLIVNIWDSNHFDDYLQKRIDVAVEEIATRWEVSYIGREPGLTDDEDVPDITYESIHEQSYTAVEKMVRETEGVGVLVYGQGHYQSINGYLDHLGVSHVDIVVDRKQFDDSSNWQEKDERLRFSVDKLEESIKK